VVARAVGVHAPPTLGPRRLDLPSMLDRCLMFPKGRVDAGWVRLWTDSGVLSAPARGHAADPMQEY